jgi:hypothetical protein
VYYADNKWVALGDTNDVAVSSNGTSWTEHAIPAGSWQTVTYGDGKFVALSSANSSPEELVSSNGTNWSAVAGPPGKWTGLTFGHGLFVAVGSQGKIVISSNGVAWTTTFSRRFDDFTSVAYGNGRYVAVDRAEGDLLTSYDGGIHWSFYPPPMANLRWGAVTFGNGNFVAFDGAGAGYMASSVLGFVWTVHQYAPAQEIDGAIFGCGSFVGVGQSSGSTNDIFSSPTGATWNAVAVPADKTAAWTDVSFGRHRFVAVNADGDIASVASANSCHPTIPWAPQQVSGNTPTNEVWTYMHPSASAGGATINGYRVNISDGVVTKRCPAPVYFQPNCIIKGLPYHQIFWVTAQAHNRYGWSVPSDPIMVIPVPSWSFIVNTTTPVVSSSQSAQLQLSGIVANSQGFYPDSLVTVHFGDRTVTCHPNPFGECLLSIANPPVGTAAIDATYTGWFGVSYRARVSYVRVVAVTASTTNVATGAPFTVTLADGVARSTARATIGGRSFSTRLGAGGGGTIRVTAPANAGSFWLSIVDDGNGLEKVLVTVHT